MTNRIYCGLRNIPLNEAMLLYGNKEDIDRIKRKNKRIVAKVEDETKLALQEI